MKTLTKEQKNKIIVKLGQYLRQITTEFVTTENPYGLPGEEPYLAKMRELIQEALEDENNT